MMIRRMQSGPFAERARRSAREIVLALALTFAALVFVAAASYRGTSETASIPADAPQDDSVPLGAQPVEGQANAPNPGWQSTKDL